MKRTLIGIILLHLMSCNNSTIKLERMPFAIIEFQNLPRGVKNYVMDIRSDFYWINESFILLNPSDTNQYAFHVQQSSFAPWIYHHSFTQLTSGITYKIETQTPYPYILYGDTLLIPCQHNIQLYRNNLTDTKFKKYILGSGQ
jgi:hypothetical protein